MHKFSPQNGFSRAVVKRILFKSMRAALSSKPRAIRTPSGWSSGPAGGAAERTIKINRKCAVFLRMLKIIRVFHGTVHMNGTARYTPYRIVGIIGPSVPYRRIPHRPCTVPLCTVGCSKLPNWPVPYDYYRGCPQILTASVPCGRNYQASCTVPYLTVGIYKPLVLRVPYRWAIHSPENNN